MASSVISKPYVAGIDTSNLISNDPTSYTATSDCYVTATTSNYGGDSHLYLDEVEICGVFYGSTTISAGVFSFPLKTGQTVRKTGGIHLAIYGIK